MPCAERKALLSMVVTLERALSTAGLGEEYDEMCGEARGLITASQDHDHSTCSALEKPMSEFTPGPWRVENDWIASSAGVTGDIICGAPPPLYLNSRANWDANCRLITAAPALFEAVKRLIGDHTIGGMWRTESEDIDFARAALSKALGASDATAKPSTTGNSGLNP